MGREIARASARSDRMRLSSDAVRKREREISREADTYTETERKGDRYVD